jgi:hypothetical protein
VSTTCSRHIASKVRSSTEPYLLPTSCPCPRFPNLRGAVPNLAFKLNASPGAPLENAERGQSAQVGAWPRWIVAPVASQSSYTRWPCIVRLISRQASIKTTCTSMFETSGPVLRQGRWRSPCTGGDWDSRVEAYCSEFPWLVRMDGGSVPHNSADVRIRVVGRGWGGCHVQPHLPQEVSLYFTWEMILRLRYKTQALGSREMILGKDTWRYVRTLIPQVRAVSKLWRSPSKVHGIGLLYSQQK